MNGNFRVNYTIGIYTCRGRGGGGWMDEVDN